MSESSPVLALPLIQPAQAQKHVTHNEALRILDAVTQLTVLSHDRSTPPDSPAVGERHIVGPAATGAWAGQDASVALFDGNGWQFFAPGAGWRADLADGRQLRHDGSGWQVARPDLDNLPGVGIGTTSGPVNRLAVASDATLFTHAGAGHQLKLDKADTAQTASLLFQTGFSGRAEMGLSGKDDWSVKVSADGTAWTEALIIDGGSGLVSGAAVQQDTADTTPGRLARTDFTYGPGNLLGTVSLQGGVPEGAVMESGGDAVAGFYLRLADGTQLCWGRIDRPGEDISTSSGAAFHSGVKSVGFPVAFAAPPAVSIAESQQGGDWDIWGLVTQVDAAGFSHLHMALSARTQDRVTHYVATGRAAGIGT